MISISEITITNSLVYAINNMLSNLLSSINENVFSYLDDLVFIDEGNIVGLSKIIGSTPNSGINLICNSLIYGFLLYYGISYLLSHLTFSQIERPSQFIFKLLICALSLNFSHFFCTGLVTICSYITNLICELGNYLFNFNISFYGLINEVLPTDYFISNAYSLFSFDGVIKTSILFGFLNLTISYAIRYIILKVLIVVSPFAILSLASTKTSPFFKSWFKNFFAMLFLQVFVALILLVCFAIDHFENILPAEIMYIGIIYALFKSNSFMKEFIGGFSTDVNLNVSNFSSLFKGGN